jgi:glycine/D-amino acid oxidase-like deaminating enzyme
MIGSDYYLGAAIDRRGGKINPLAYVRGLARAAIKAGAALHEGTRATKLARGGGRWKLIVMLNAMVRDGTQWQPRTT